MLVKIDFVVPARLLLALVYLVGLVGFVFPQTEALFARLVPVNLLFSLILILFFQQNWSLKMVFCLLLIGILGFVAELVGTQTGLLFGNYSYGSVLGPRVWSTPLLIAVNWLVLVWGLQSFWSRYISEWLAPWPTALLMTAFDWVMEPVAVHLGMWSWENGSIPLRNYTDWFVLSLVLSYLPALFRTRICNPLAAWIVLMQFLFFLSLNVLIHL